LTPHLFKSYAHIPSDQGYWQRAIASRPSTAVQAYILGGFAWFAIPFGFATTLGLAAVALTNNPAYPTYPNTMTQSQISAGLSAPFGAAALLGQRGAIALLITLFMAVTSSSSSELIAVSSILTFDIYKMYFKPKATPDQLIFVSHMMICIFGVVMASFACLWQGIGIDLGWLFLVMGLIIGGAVFPAAFTVTWKKQSKAGAIAGCLCGLAAGLIAWLVEAHVHYGELTIASTGASYPTLAGNMAAVFTGLLVTVVVSYIKPANFDWELTRAINAVDGSETATPAVLEGHSPPGASTASSVHGTSTPTQEKKSHEDQVSPERSLSAHLPSEEKKIDHSNLPTVIDEYEEEKEDQTYLEDPKKLRRAFVLAVIMSSVLSFVMDFLIPMPMFFSHYVFSKGFFIGWVVISFIWVFFALLTCGVLPLWETRVFWKELYGEIVIKKRTM
jgi:hypothetical protein